MKTKLFTALLCAMCIGLVGCNKNGNDPESPSSNVGIRQAAGYTIYEVTIDGKQMWFSRETDAADTTQVYLTSAYAFYQVVDDTKEYAGDFVVPSTFTALGVDFHVVGLQKALGSSGYYYSGVCPFNSCSKLLSVTIPFSISIVEKFEFCHLPELTTLTFNSVDTIAPNAISNCPKLKTINLPNNLRAFGEQAISNCGIETITIPASVNAMGFQTISSCHSLKKVYMMPTTPPMGKPFGVYCDSLQAIYVPSASVNAYKEADFWCDYAGIITAIP